MQFTTVIITFLALCLFITIVMAVQAIRLIRKHREAAINTLTAHNMELARRIQFALAECRLPAANCSRQELITRLKWVDQYLDDPKRL